MGFSTLLDIIGSTLIGGMLILILFRMNDAAVENTYTYGQELIVQQNLVEVVTLLEHDLRKIGYCADWQQIPNPSKSILEAGPHNIKFLTDFPTEEGGLGDGVLDELEYYVSGTGLLSGTSNPRDIMLYRVENDDSPKGANLGVTQFDLVYYNTLGQVIPFPITDPGEIERIEINITVESTELTENWLSEPESQKYISSYWRQIRLAAKNLDNR